MSDVKIEPGDELYVGSQWYIDHGEDDMCGGIGIVKRLKVFGTSTFVEFKGLNHSPNLDFILEHQDEWEEEYGDRLAHPCPEGQKCPNLRRKCGGCGGTGCVACNWTGKGTIKKNPTISRNFMVDLIKRRALRSKLMRQARREL